MLEESLGFDAEEARKRLSAQGVGTRPFFYPMHEQPVLKAMGLFDREHYPVAEQLAWRGFYLPSGLSKSISLIIKSIARYLEIGVQSGLTFNQLDFPSKVAVDPHVSFEFKKYASSNTLFFEKTSDLFWVHDLQDWKFDLIFSLENLQEAFDTCGLPDVVEHGVTGYLAKPFDAADLAHGIGWVLKHSDPAGLRRQARERAVERFASATVAEKYQAVYRQMLG